MKVIVCILAVWSLSLTCACQSTATSQRNDGASRDWAAAGMKAPGAAKLGDKTVCPVTGDEFVVAADSPHAEFEGKTFYFCCDGCQDDFAKDPKAALKSVGL